jgi:hypothetical protein
VRKDNLCVNECSVCGGILELLNPSAAAHCLNGRQSGSYMRTRNLLVGAVLTIFLITLGGCAAGNHLVNGQPPPPVTGPYTNSNLNGSYAFLIRGTNTGFFSIAGTFQANGAGMITAGTEDINSPGTGVLMNNVSITGTYSVLADGRTTANIISPAGNFVLDFVLLSNQHGLAMRFNNNATASGNVDLQDSTAFSAATFQGAYAFTLQGADHAGNLETSAGAFTTLNVSNVNTIQTGVQDFNDNGVTSANRVLSGSFTNPVTGRGVAALNSNVGALNFIYYVVDANHLLLIETDTQPVLAGNAYRQSGAAIPATLVLTLSGSAGALSLGAGAILKTDSNGNVLTTSTEDVNKAGTITQNLSVSGVYSAISNGRATITLPGSVGLTNLVVYPTDSGFLLMSVDNSAVVTGTAFAQQITTPSNSSLIGRYGFTLAGSNTVGPVDAIAQFTADGKGNIAGNLDENSNGSLGSGLSLTGTYTIAATGRGTSALTSSAGNMNLILYMVDASDFIFVEVDTGQVATGRIQTQQ